MAEEFEFKSPHGMHSDEDGIESGDDQDNSKMRERDRFLPLVDISRIMKKALPGNVEIKEDAQKLMQECVAEFILFVTNEARNKCTTNKRDTISEDDLLSALSSLGFDDYLEALQMFLDKYRETKGGDSGFEMDEPEDENSGESQHETDET